MRLLNTIYKILILVGVGVLLFTVIYRPSNIIGYIIIGDIFLFLGAILLLRERRKKNEY